MTQESQRQFMRDVSKIIVETVCKTVETLFSVSLNSKEIAGIDKLCESDFICIVRLHEGEKSATVRFGFEYSLMKRLVTTVYSEEMAADKAVLRDAGSEVANIVSGRVKEYLNSKGLNLVTDIPSTIEGPLDAHNDGSTVDLIFYNADDHLVVDVDLGSAAVNQ
jgi:CheY-specific phosphatase CheX